MSSVAAHHADWLGSNTTRYTAERWLDDVALRCGVALSPGHRGQSRHDTRDAREARAQPLAEHRGIERVQPGLPEGSEPCLGRPDQPAHASQGFVIREPGGVQGPAALISLDVAGDDDAPRDLDQAAKRRRHTE